MTAVDEAFQAVRREGFLPKGLNKLAGLDVPLPIGRGQTISQPTTVRYMLEWLDPKPGDKILDIGSGSGWSSALLAYLAGPKGKIYAVERIPELLEFGKRNCQKAGFLNVEFFVARKDYGLPEYAPYDKILVSASASSFPQELLSQLRQSGKLIVPVQNDILEVTKTIDGYETVSHPGFVFVPLV
jgi:protein-L-isoaspartate(D-aspartate) O-methyltransferase